MAPEFPEAAAVGTASGAEAFYRYFWAVYGYSDDSMDTSLLREISDPQCAFCRETADAIDAHRITGGTYRGGLVSVTSVAVEGFHFEDDALVRAHISQPPSQALDRSGAVISAGPRLGDLAVPALCLWQDGAWVLRAIDAGH